MNVPFMSVTYFQIKLIDKINFWSLDSTLGHNGDKSQSLTACQDTFRTSSIDKVIDCTAKDIASMLDAYSADDLSLTWIVRWNDLIPS